MGAGARWYYTVESIPCPKCGVPRSRQVAGERSRQKARQQVCTECRVRDAAARQVGERCRQCGVNKARKGCYGLCKRCRKAVGVQVATGVAVAVERRRGEWHEPTEEELEVMIAEQMRCLPKWWSAETRKMQEYDNADP